MGQYFDQLPLSSRTSLWIKNICKKNGFYFCKYIEKQIRKYAKNDIQKYMQKEIQKYFVRL